MYLHLLFFLLATLLSPAVSSGPSRPKFVKPKPPGPPPDPALSKVILRWMADGYRQKYNDNMLLRNQHHAKANEIVQTLPFMGHVLNPNNIRRMKHRWEGLQAYKRGYEAANIITRIATVNKDIEAVPRPLKNKYEDFTRGYDPAYDDLLESQTPSPRPATGTRWWRGTRRTLDPLCRDTFNCWIPKGDKGDGHDRRTGKAWRWGLGRGGKGWEQEKQMKLVTKSGLSEPDINKSLRANRSPRFGQYSLDDLSEPRLSNAGRASRSSQADESPRGRQPGCVFQSGKWLCGLSHLVGRVGKRGEGGKQGGARKNLQAEKSDHEVAGGQVRKEV